MAGENEPQESMDPKAPSFFGKLKRKMVGDAEAQILLGTGVSNIGLGFVVPFILQAGMGSSMESSAIRGGLLGLANGLTSAATYGISLAVTDGPAAATGAYTGASAIVAPVVNTALYGIGQQVIGVRSQGAVKDATFAFISSQAVAGGTVAAFVGVTLLMGLKAKVMSKM